MGERNSALLSISVKRFTELIIRTGMVLMTIQIILCPLYFEACENVPDMTLISFLRILAHFAVHYHAL